MLQSFNILATSLSVLHNYFDMVQQNYFQIFFKVFKVLDISAKSLFLS